MFDKSISPIRPSESASDKTRTGGNAMIRLLTNRLALRQRAERERRDRYGRFGGR